MATAREYWSGRYRLARQLKSLRRQYESRLPDQGVSILGHADSEALDASLWRCTDPLAFPVDHRLRCKRAGYAYQLGERSRLPA